MRLVNADELRKKAVPHTRGSYGFSADIRKWAVLVGDIDDTPTIDPIKHGYVPTEVLEQIQWERDVAIDQLNSYGVQFGEKADVQKVKHGKWIIAYDDYKFTMWDACSICGHGLEFVGVGKDYNFCPNCGARMDVE